MVQATCSDRATESLGKERHGAVSVHLCFDTVKGKIQQGKGCAKAVLEYQAGQPSEVLLISKAAVSYAWSSLQYLHAILLQRACFVEPATTSVLLVHFKTILLCILFEGLHGLSSSWLALGIFQVPKQTQLNWALRLLRSR